MPNDHEGLEHDSLDDRAAGATVRAFEQAPADKMIRRPVKTKTERVIELRRELRREMGDQGPHLREDNPDIWDGEID